MRLTSGRAAGVALAFALSVASSLGAQANETWRSWNQPVEPFRIFGPLYYVGANDITAYAIATAEGLIVLDGGFPETAAQIEKNLETLGFRLADVKLLLNSHAHFDHAGGLAALAAKSGATLVATSATRRSSRPGGVGTSPGATTAAFRR